MARRIINIITPHYSPEVTAAAHRMEAAAKILSGSFHVNVIALRADGGKQETISCEEHLTVHYLAAGKYNKSFFPLRAFFELWYSFMLVRRSNKIDSDLVIVTSPFMFLLPVVMRFCTARKKIADVRDLVWHYLPSDSFFKRKVKKRLTKVMHNALRKFDAIAVTNEAERKWLVSSAMTGESTIEVIPNGVSYDKFRRLTEVKYSTSLDRYTITYVGNVGKSQEFISLINAVKNMRDVRLNIIGGGNALNGLRKFVASNEIKNVFLPGRLNWSRALPYYQTSDLLFASLKKNYSTAVPSKLYEYLSTGLPVLYVGKGAAYDLLRIFKNVFVAGGANEKFLENMIWKLRKISPERSEINMQHVRKYFIREKVSRGYVELAARVLNDRTLSDVYVEDILLKSEL